jgi:Holliday junction resolvase
MASKNETYLMRAVKGLFEAYGFGVVRMPPSIYTSGKGIPDLLVMKEGRVWFVELKTPRGKLSPHQERFRMFCEYYNVPYIVIRSLEEAQMLIQNILHSEKPHAFSESARKIPTEKGEKTCSRRKSKV